MKSLSQRPSGFQYAFLRKLAIYVSLFGTALLAVPFFYLSEKYDSSFLRGCGVAVSILGLLFTFFTVREVLYRMEEDGSLLFRPALAATFWNYVLHLCFLPIVGPYIEMIANRKREKNPFASAVDEFKR
jgi:lipopolysaccharide export LptBFGC system permease protein LptF